MQRERAFHALVGIVVGMAACAFAFAAFTYNSRESTSDLLWQSAALAVIALIAEEMSVEVRAKVTVAADGLALLLAVLFLGPLPAMCIGAVVGLWGWWRENSWWVVAYNCANLSLSAFVAGEVYLTMMGAEGLSTSAVSLAFIGAGAAAAFSQEVVNLILTSLGARAKYGASLRAFWREEMPETFRSLAVLAALGVAIAALWVEAGMIAVVLLFAPLLAAQYMFRLLVREREHLARQTELSEQYLEMNIGLAAAMVVLIDSKDEYTASHSAAVAMYCRDMAVAVGMDERDIEEIHVAGILHDLGKVGTPDAILRKPEALTAEEWIYIHEHPAKGAEVLSHLATYRNVAAIVRHHHERLDGSGYPDGLTGDRIPEASKILAVADSYHAITSDRPYCAARSSFEALKELRRVAGTWLEPRYVEALAQVLRDKDLAYRDGTSTDFMDEVRRGKINLRLREESLTGTAPPQRAREDPAAS